MIPGISLERRNGYCTFLDMFMCFRWTSSYSKPAMVSCRSEFLQGGVLSAAEQILKAASRAQPLQTSLFAVIYRPLRPFRTIRSFTVPFNMNTLLSFPALHTPKAPRRVLTEPGSPLSRFNKVDRPVRLPSVEIWREVCRVRHVIPYICTD